MAHIPRRGISDRVATSMMANQTKDTPNVAIMTTAAATALNPTSPKALGPTTPPFDFDVTPAGLFVDGPLAVVGTGDAAPDPDPEPELESPDDDPEELVLEEVVPGEVVPELLLAVPVALIG